jgi:hypothetical protein
MDEGWTDDVMAAQLAPQGRNFHKVGARTGNQVKFHLRSQQLFIIGKFRPSPYPN